MIFAVGCRDKEDIVTLNENLKKNGGLQFECKETKKVTTIGSEEEEDSEEDIKEKENKTISSESDEGVDEDGVESKLTSPNKKQKVVNGRSQKQQAKARGVKAGKRRG